MEKTGPSLTPSRWSNVTFLREDDVPEFGLSQPATKVRYDNKSFSGRQEKTNPPRPVLALSKQTRGVC